MAQKKLQNNGLWYKGHYIENGQSHFFKYQLDTKGKFINELKINKEQYDKRS